MGTAGATSMTFTNTNSSFPALLWPQRRGDYEFSLVAEAVVQCNIIESCCTPLKLLGRIAWT